MTVAKSSLSLSVNDHDFLHATATWPAHGLEGRQNHVRVGDNQVSRKQRHMWLHSHRVMVKVICVTGNCHPEVSQLATLKVGRPYNTVWLAYTVCQQHLARQKKVVYAASLGLGQQRPIVMEMLKGGGIRLRGANPMATARTTLTMMLEKKKRRRWSKRNVQVKAKAAKK
ncbi:hypothetical protein ARMGADRAFT_1063579 [Armillaria gallica]|uniref:Uncharacterized protein n=1 Tax=Armillaria gallica TaxID=47427 RepID=A0A2H3DBV2_ARMGA|nr:hypothetical protein ARMGADRAFT_1063579 [Armillaria gallica]